MAGAWTFAADDADPEARWRPGRHRVTVCYLDEDPVTVAATLGPVLTGGVGREAGGLEPVFAGPFETITPWRWDWFE